MIYTSYYARVKQLETSGIVPIAISVGKPRWFRGESIDSLAPTRAMLKMGDVEYSEHYQRILEANTPEDIARRVRGRDVALLCWEKDVNECHRKMVGEWLREAGIECEEWQPESKRACREDSRQLALI